jgi:hypothetical protein
VLCRQVGGDDAPAQKCLRILMTVNDLGFQPKNLDYLADHLPLQARVENAYPRLPHTPCEIIPYPEVILIERVVCRVRLQGFLASRPWDREGVAGMLVPIDESWR